MEEACPAFHFFGPLTKDPSENDNDSERIGRLWQSLEVIDPLNLMRILFINPPLEHAITYPGPNRVVMQHDYAPPLGLMSLSAYVKERGFRDIRLINGQIPRPVKDSEILDTVRSYKPDVVGITLTTLVYYNGIRIASLIKETSPQTHVVVGGPHVSLFPVETVSQTPVDSAIVGEGEEGFCELLKALESSSDLGSIRGLVWKKGQEIHQNSARESIESLDRLPMPDYSLYDMKYHRVRFDDIAPTAVIITSRGCPFQCTFCSQVYPEYRARSAESVVREMLALKGMGYRSVSFWDDTFNLSRNRVLEICELIRQAKVDMPWSFRGRVTGFDEEMAISVKGAGCIRAHFGVESGTQDLLDRIKKGITLEQIRTAFALCKKHKIQTMAFFMIGLPGETVAQAKKTIQLAFEIDPDFAVFHTLIPFPGSQIYQDAVSAGAFPDYIKEFSLHPTPSLRLQSWETGMTEKEAYNLFRQALLRFYFRPSYILKTLRRIGSFENFLIKASTALRVLFRLRHTQ